MSLTTNDFAEFLHSGDDERPLGDALDELAIDIEVDSVEEVRELRERTPTRIYAQLSYHLTWRKSNGKGKQRRKSLR